MKISKKDDFLKGIVTNNGKIACNKCKKILMFGEDIFTDGSQINFDLCKKCYEEVGK